MKRVLKISVAVVLLLLVNFFLIFAVLILFSENLPQSSVLMVWKEGEGVPGGGHVHFG